MVPQRGRFSAMASSRPAIILGGAPCLLPDLEKIPKPLLEEALKFSANEHGARVLPVDWCVSGDRNHQVTGESMYSRVRQFHAGNILTQHFVEGTTRLHTWNQWKFPASSGHMAILWAWLLNCSPIIVCGIEHYTGKTYHHDPAAKSSGLTKTADRHMDGFKKLFFQIQPSTIRAVSGPLARVTGTFRPGEHLPVMGRLHHRREVYWHQSFAWFEFLESHSLTKVGPQSFKVGDRAFLTETEAKDGIKFGWLRKIPDVQLTDQERTRRPIDQAWRADQVR
jgi:hypothetical protein